MRKAASGATRKRAIASGAAKQRPAVDLDALDLMPDAGEPEELALVDVLETSAASKAPAAPLLRVKVSRSKERALAKEFGLDLADLGAEEIQLRREELKKLILLGKTRGYLTSQEVNDHLPERLVATEAVDSIVTMLTEMGVAVYEQAPDAAMVLMSGEMKAVTQEEAEEVAEAAASTVDSEFGRTTDPMRMYMREVNAELLTREGEIEIAKRIEAGRHAMLAAIARCPAVVAEILADAERVAEGSLAITNLVDGFVVANAADDYVAEEEFDSFDEDDEGAVLNRYVFRSPSVFNFYSPNSPIAGTDLVGPAFGIHSASHGTGQAQLHQLPAVRERLAARRRRAQCYRHARGPRALHERRAGRHQAGGPHVHARVWTAAARERTHGSNPRRRHPQRRQQRHDLPPHARPDRSLPRVRLAALPDHPLRNSHEERHANPPARHGPPRVAQALRR